MKVNRRTQADRSAATRAVLVGAARPLFAERGFGGVGTETIVQAAGVTRGALYHQFADKTELFEAVYEAVEEDLTGRLAQRIVEAGVSDPIDVMRLGADAWLDACAEQEVQQIVLLDAPAVLGWERWREISLRHGLGLLEGMLTHAIELGRISPNPLAPWPTCSSGRSTRRLCISPAQRIRPPPARRSVPSSLSSWPGWRQAADERGVRRLLDTAGVRSR